MDHIILIAQQIAKEGKTPNTASIKARLPKNTPLPMIIQGLKMWQENPDKEIESTPVATSNTTADKKESGTIDAIIEAKIEEKIAPLQKEISQLKDTITSLETHLISISQTTTES